MADRILTLVRDDTPADGNAADVVHLPTAAKPNPLLDAALDALADPNAGIALDDAVETALERLHRRSGHTPLGALMADVWRAGAVYGYQAAHIEQPETDLGESVAEVIAFRLKNGGTA